MINAIELELSELHSNWFIEKCYYIPYIYYTLSYLLITRARPHPLGLGPGPEAFPSHRLSANLMGELH